MKPRQIAHRGTVEAAALWVDESIAGIAMTRQRILAMPGVEEVRRMADGLFIKLNVPVRMSTGHAPGVPLVVCHEFLAAVPLDPDEIEMLGAPNASVVLVRAGEIVVISPDTSPVEDLSTWIDLSEWSVVPVKPLGEVLMAPRAAPVAKDLDTRQAAGIGPASAEAQALLEALAQAKANTAKTNSNSGLLPSLLGSVSTFLSTLAARLGKSAPRGDAGTTQNKSLVVRPAEPARGNAFSERLRLALNHAAAKLLIWARLASWIGRRQAEYLSKTFDLFDSGDLEQALRHAIPLGSGSGQPASLALGVPVPRADLSIQATRSGAASVLGFGGDVFDALRIRYRKAVETLEKQGRIKEAAFVLAELLNASEEAVSFLEKHREYRMAAELAEGRNLDPALIVRQWLLAGDRARAILIARRTGAFAAAIAKLEPSHPEQAAVLRALWANQLAEAGAYSAAVQTIWPVEHARNIARDWIERGLEIGGAPAAKLLAMKAALVPEAFDSVVKAVRAFPRNDHDESIEMWRALGQSLLDHPAPRTTRILARTCVRALLPHARTPVHHAQLDRLVKLAEDPVLQADLRGWKKPEQAAKNIRIRAASLTDVGKHRTVNEDGYLMGLLGDEDVTPFAGVINTIPLPARGALFIVADGMGGRNSTEVVKEAFKTILLHMKQASLERMGADLVYAVEQAGAAIYRKAEQDRSFAGSGATITAALLVGDTLWIVQCGDTRAYIFRDSKLVQVTKDHSLLEYMLEMGQLSREEAEEFPHKNVVTHALGLSERPKVDVWRVRLCPDDRILLCTDGVHGILPPELLAKALTNSTTPNACALLKKMAYEQDAPDNLALIVVDVLGNSDQFSGGQEIIAERIIVEPQERPAPEKRTITRNAADTGTMPVHDAAILPGGRLLVALGEAGVRMLSPEGKILVHFHQPAERLVMSDHGDRAIGLARRGDAYRLTRIDLMGRRARPWMDVSLRQFADSFDGSSWFVAVKDTVYAIDALEDDFQAIWQLTEADSIPLAIARSATAASFHLGREIWTFDLPSFRLRSRRTVDDLKKPMAYGPWLTGDGQAVTWLFDEEKNQFSPALRYLAETSWTRIGDGVIAAPNRLQAVIQGECTHAAFARVTENEQVIEVFDVASRLCSLRVELAGATRTRMRFQEHRLILADDQGRVLVIGVGQSKVIAEWRV